jgi:hypothetical protein
MTKEIDKHADQPTAEHPPTRCELCHWWIGCAGCCCAISPLRSRDPGLVCDEFEPHIPKRPLSKPHFGLMDSGFATPGSHSKMS